MEKRFVLLTDASRTLGMYIIYVVSKAVRSRCKKVKEEKKQEAEKTREDQRR